jgi:curved DNA-binding protein CbpA
MYEDIFLVDFKDYYSLLGVLQSADPEIIRSVYHALSKKYHPDVSSRDDAENFIRELNEAYEVLGDRDKRKAYDQEYDKHRDETSFFRGSDHNDAFFETISEDWSIATEYYPDLEAMRAELEKLSSDLALVFVITVLEEKCFKDADRVKKSLSSRFLSKFFGTYHSLRAFARRLLLEGRQDIALELNKAVRVLGVEISPDDVKRRLIAKYKLDPEIYGVRAPTQWPDRIGREVFVEEHGGYGVYRMGNDKFFIYSAPNTKTPGSVTYSSLREARAVIEKS